MTMACASDDNTGEQAAQTLVTRAKLETEIYM